jgi:dihydrofolate reductase
MPANRKVILFIAVSLDGFIAGPDENLDFLSIVQKEGEDYGYADFIKNVDTVILGRKTYDWVMKQVEVFPHAGLNSYIITRSPGKSIGMTNFYTGNLQDLVIQLKTLKGKNIFIDGGSEIINELLKHSLIDEFIISVIPVLLGNGVRLFKDGLPEQNLKLLNVRHFNTGLIQLHYEKTGK